MSWLSYFYPLTIARLNSDYNREILIVETFGKFKLLVNGSPQSGPYINKLWKEAFKSFKITKSLPISSILVLGLGGGTIIRLLKGLFPQAEITAVEIDPVMVKIARNYFDLTTENNLKIINSDARDYMRPADSKHKYDLIIADLFSGRKIPKFVESEDFLNQAKKSLSGRGILIINYLREREYYLKSEALLHKLKYIFTRVMDKKMFLNRFFFCQ